MPVIQTANGPKTCSESDYKFYQEINLFAWNDGPMYDTWRFHGGTTIAAQQRRTFAVVLGQSGDGFDSPDQKTYAETNHTESGKMSGDRAFRVCAIGVNITSVNGSVTEIDDQHRDVLAIMREFVLAFQSADNIRFYGRISEFPGGGGPSGFAAIGTTDAGSAPSIREVEAITNGLPSFGSMVRLGQEINLAPGQSFSWLLQNGRAIALRAGSTFAYDVMVKLWGMSGVRVAG